MKRRLIFLLLAAAMLFSAVLVVSAENTVAENAETPVIAVQEVWGEAGTTVEVNVTITGTPGLLGAVVNISWDEELNLIKASSGSAFADLAYQEPSKFSHTGTNFVWYGLELETVSDGTILTLTYQISEDAQEWNQYGIYLTCKSSDCYDQDQNPVNISTKNGTALVITYIPGDADDNGKVEVQDLILLSRYISDGCVTDPEGYNAAPNTMAADVNNSGAINPLDLSILAQYISDGGTDPQGYNAVLMPAMPKCLHSNVEYVAAKEPTYTETGNRAYWHCGICDGYFSDEACKNAISYEDTVIPVKTGYAIEYHLYDNREYLQENGVENSNPAYYDSNDGLKLKNLKKDGYVFDGWYDGAGESAERITEIAAGETGNLELYAHWTPVEYNIAYYEYGSHTNVTTYTIEERIVLSDPNWIGRRFVEWVDSEGQPWSEIPVGSTGNLELTATWKSNLNVAHPSSGNEKIMVIYNENQNVYHFIYALGTLEHVTLEEMKDIPWKFKNEQEVVTFEYSESVTIEQDFSNTIAETVSTSVSTSTEWSQTVENAGSKTTETFQSMTGGLEFGPEDVKAKIEYSNGKTESDTSSWSQSRVDGGRIDNGSEQSYESASTISYMNQISTTVTGSHTVTENMPEGYYGFAKLGNIKVYAVVSYAPDTDSYFLDTYSILDNSHQSVIYVSDPGKLNDDSCDSLPYFDRIGEIEDWIENRREVTVNFDPNGGVVETGKKTAIYDTSYGVLPIPTRDGYVFNGWMLQNTEVTSNTNVNIATAHTLVARWKEKAYNISYDLSRETIVTDPTKGGMDYPETVVFGQAFTLPVPETPYYEFGGWYTSDGVRLTDENGEGLRNWNIPEDTTVYVDWVKKYSDYTYVYSLVSFDAIRKNPSGNYMIVKDITLGGMEPIPNFSGILDGRGHTLSGWTYQQKTVGNIGIFGENSGTICNLNLTDCEITTDVSPKINGQLNAGILCGKNTGTIENVKIWDCHYHTDVGGIDEGAHTITYAGFVCGENWGNILKCSVLNSNLYAYTGTEWWSSWTLVGSIVGNVKAGTVQDVLASGNTIEGAAEAYANVGWFGECHGHGELNVAVGGIAGWAHDGTVRRAVSQDNTLTPTKKRECGCSNLMLKASGHVIGYLEDTTLTDCYAQTGKTLIGGGNSSTGAMNLTTEAIWLAQLSKAFQTGVWLDDDGRIMIDHTVLTDIIIPE